MAAEYPPRETVFCSPDHAVVAVHDPERGPAATRLSRP